MRVPITNCQLLLVCAILGNCAILFYISHVQETTARADLTNILQNGGGDELARELGERSWHINDNRERSRKAFEAEVTVVILEFEDFENDIPRTVRSIVKVLPKIHLIVLAQRRPYPPLELEGENVQLVVQQIPVDQRQSSGRPENYISTPYVLIIPDGARFDSARLPMSMLTAIKSTQKSLSKIVALPVESRKPLECYTLKVDLKRWTLGYVISKNFSGDFKLCDEVSPSPAVILKTAFLHSLSMPYMRPFPKSLFIQASIHHIHTKVMYKSALSSGTELFTNPHTQWKHERNAKQRLTRMYERFGLKKVELPFGKKEWFGCSKNTKRCFGTIVDDMPEYLYNNQWTPPCCLNHLRETARYVFKVLEKSKVSYWLEGGSLLGAARNGDIIPWDYDVDIGIYQSEIKKCEFLNKALELFRSGSKFVDNSGFVWEKASDGEFFRVQYSQFNHLHVDIFPFYEKNGKMTKDTWIRNHQQDTEFPAHYLKPLTKIQFVGVKASAPNHVKEFLEYKFGKGVIEHPQYPDPSRLKKKNKSQPEKKLAL